MDNKFLQDELDQINIDQLHKAVLQFSNNCFEIKKFCVTVIISAATLITSITKEKLESSVFLVGVIIVTFFWIIDSQNYFYQEKLRSRMKELANNISQRRDPQIIVDGVGMPLEVERAKRSIFQRVMASLFNWSMIFYLFLALAIIVSGLYVYKQIYLLLVVVFVVVGVYFYWNSNILGKDK